MKSERRDTAAIVAGFFLLIFCPWRWSWFKAGRDRDDVEAWLAAGSPYLHADRTRDMRRVDDGQVTTLDTGTMRRSLLVETVRVEIDRDHEFRRSENCTYDCRPSSGYACGYCIAENAR